MLAGQTPRHQALHRPSAARDGGRDARRGAGEGPIRLRGAAAWDSAGAELHVAQLGAVHEEANELHVRRALTPSRDTRTSRELKRDRHSVQQGRVGAARGRLISVWMSLAGIVDCGLEVVHTLSRWGGLVSISKGLHITTQAQGSLTQMSGVSCSSQLASISGVNHGVNTKFLPNKRCE